MKILTFGLLFLIVFILITSRTSIIPDIQSMVVLSGSMEPSIKTGSIVFVQKDAFYQVGDAIAFKNQSNVTITHRIIEKIQKPEGIYYKVKGDANNAPDLELIPKGAIIGKTIFSLPFLGRLTVFLKTPLGFISLIIIPALIFIAFEVFNIKKELEKEIEKKLLQKINSG